MSIETYGSGERLRIAAALTGKRYTRGDHVLLPVPTSRDGRTVTGTDIPLSLVAERIEPGTFVAGYGFSEDFTAALRERGARLLDLSRDEEYLKENARLTAVGAIGYILTTERRAPSDIRFGVVGYGRIGSELVRLLLSLGAHPLVYSTRLGVRLMLAEDGIDAAPCEKISRDLSSGDVDILINTAPVDHSEDVAHGAENPGARIIELASGRNFVGVRGVEDLPSLPERMFPDSAGRTYFEAIERFIENRNGT